MAKKLLEVCVDSMESALNAHLGGADRIELCAALSEGGLTPNLGLFVQLKKKIPTDETKIFVMLRPRRGADFAYSEDEIQSILVDVEEFKKRGCDGFVFGALKSATEIDVANCARIVQACSPLPVTFHRAFDVMEGDPEAHLQTIIDLGFKRLLTSGRHPTASKGLDNIARWNAKMGMSITIMPGSGVNAGNLEEIINASGCMEFHSSCKETTAPSTNPIIGDLEGVVRSDLQKVRDLVAIIDKQRGQ